MDVDQNSRHPRIAGGCCWSSPVGFWSPGWPFSPQMCLSSPPEVSLKSTQTMRTGESWEQNQDWSDRGPEQTLEPELFRPGCEGTQSLDGGRRTSTSWSVWISKPQIDLQEQLQLLFTLKLVPLTCFVFVSFQLLQSFFVLFVFFMSFWDFGSVKERDSS